jgi:hypothetical protein
MGKRRYDQARVGEVATFIEKGASLEREGRYGEATQSYEIAGRWKDAARARPRSRGRTVRHIDANLDDLMSDLRREGLSLDYRCKACGSTWKVDGKGHDPWQKRCPKCSENIDGAILLKGLRELTSLDESVPGWSWTNRATILLASISQGWEGFYHSMGQKISVMYSLGHYMYTNASFLKEYAEWLGRMNS